MTPAERTYIPESEFGKVFWRARIYLLIYLAVHRAWRSPRAASCRCCSSACPAFYGTWLMVVYGLTQHAGLAENVLDHRLNTRTVYMNPINRYLYWNMGYHVEHHMFPMVPYHNLPKLHELVKSDVPPPYNGLVEAYREIIPTLIRQSKDPDYFVQRPLPAPAPQAETARTAQVITSDGQPRRRGLGRGVRPEPAAARRRAALRSRGQHLRHLPHADRPAVRHRRPLHPRPGPPGGWLPAGHLHRVHQAQRPLRHPRWIGASPAPAPALRTYQARERDGKVLLNVAAAQTTPQEPVAGS